MKNESFDKYDKITVYGVGAIGTIFLHYLSECNVDKSKVVAYDMKYNTPSKILEYDVVFPVFEQANKPDNTLVIIALCPTKSRTVNEIKQKFVDAGYCNIKLAKDTMEVSKEAEMVCFDTFSDIYESTYQDNIDFSGHAPLVKPVVYYLPQFHEIPENNEWWGEGFTEWTNTQKAKPNYSGHYQPREPHDDIGYYDLSEVEAVRKQAKLARRHGIFGWAIYYYWFSGKTFLSKPIEIIYQNKDIDINYCLCWCNEKWTKIWVGDERKVLAENEYNENDPERFIDDLQKYMHDERYIKIDEKPVLIVYQAHIIPNVAYVVDKWRERARKVGIGEIFILSSIQPLTLKENGLEGYFDGEAEFSNLTHVAENIQVVDKNGGFTSNSLCYYDTYVDYYTGVSNENIRDVRYYSVACGFDNTPRYGERATIFDVGFSLKSWYKLCKSTVEKSVQKGNEYMFVFAWNEWAESAYLEPDKKYGYATINTLSKAVCGLPFEKPSETLLK
jgi:hypothetical protein